MLRVSHVYRVGLAPEGRTPTLVNASHMVTFQFLGKGVWRKLRVVLRSDLYRDSGAHVGYPLNDSELDFLKEGWSAFGGPVI